MHSDTDFMPREKTKTIDDALKQKHLHDMAARGAENKILIARHDEVLKEEGMRKEMEQLELWLEVERKGPAPAGIISESGIRWLSALRDRMKLSADEAQRLEGEGGNPASKEQNEKNEALLKTI